MPTRSPPLRPARIDDVDSIALGGGRVESRTDIGPGRGELIAGSYSGPSGLIESCMVGAVVGVSA